MSTRFILFQRRAGTVDIARMELSEKEKVRVMLAARAKGCSLIECHSHRHPAKKVKFSPSDERGLEEFLGYVKWKLRGKTYGAIVFGDSSMEGRLWLGAVPPPIPICQIRITKQEVLRRRVTGLSEQPKKSRPLRG